MKIIQMGMGGMGNAWIEAVTASELVSYAAFVEINPQIAFEQRRKHSVGDIPVFNSLEKALAAVEADGVVAVIPPQFRIETAEICFEAGLPLLSEKPLAESMEEAIQLLEMSQSSGLLYMVGQDYRYKPTMQTLKRLLTAEAMGRINAIDIGHYRSLVGTSYHARMEYPILLDMAIHHFDLVRFFLEDEPVSLYGHGWNPAHSTFQGKAAVAALLTFPNSTTVTYHASWASMGQITTWDGDWRFECEKGVVILKDDQVSLQRRTGKDNKGFIYGDIQEVDLVKMKFTRQAALIQEFYTAVMSGKPPATTIQDNIYSLQIVFDLIEACKTGEVIRR